MPLRPRMLPPVGKSGPGTYSITCWMVRAGSSISAQQASISSPRLCGGMLVAMHRAEVALPRDQRQAHGEVLRHAHHGVVDRRVTVRMILAHHVTDDAGGLAERPRRVVAALLHRVEDAPLHRLKPVARVRQSARH